ncbi:EVE domain-containing protein [candidate division KSB3 bacterium]|uniref:EVE domain-containing protein n=1 Tax=candidate division KSB3 bacterium TaxID=2044937 RepID=A0A9D5JXD5_9BACT|nr:EVE domain-containing protein [candidate division KSB3 bacterium]MBD3325870.1 EVE domain-containing protein [candidate division KSB3 bacterium]
MEERNYWLDLFTGKTWEKFLQSGASVSGFRKSRQKLAKKIQLGDYLICYITGIQRFIGVLEVRSYVYIDDTPIWEDETFPCRFDVKLLHQLTPLTAIPVKSLRSQLTIFQNLKSPRAWTGFFRGSPAQFKQADGKIIVDVIKQAVEKPIETEFDEKLYWRKPRTYESSVGVVTVPDDIDTEEEQPKEAISKKEQPEKSSHQEIQWLLLNLGSELGLDVWVARNDRNQEFHGTSFQNIPRLRKELPRQFDEATNRTIELIDVLWLQGDAIVAAFEVEHTSAIYSGLLRMSDLVSMQPNLKINLYIVAPDERREKVFNELNRPTFARLRPPLPKICQFIPYSELKAKIEGIGEMLKYMKPEFLEEIAESCETDEAS